MKAAIVQFMFCGAVMAAVPALAQNWTLTGAPSKNWTSIASSSDGTKLAATAAVSMLYTSTNSGATWQTNALVNANHAVFSADGTTLAAVSGPFVFVSTNGGATWQTNGPIGQDLSGLACSADAMKLVAINPVGNGGHIFTSIDGGLTWATNALTGYNWSGVAASADGNKLIVSVNSGGNVNPQIFTSTNGGAAWLSNIVSAPVQSWGCVALSPDGTKWVAGLSGNGGAVYTSADAGNTWASNAIPHYTWSSLASSADGTRLVVCSVGFGKIYTSVDSGVTWASNSVPVEKWQEVVSSADGSKLAAIANGGGIYTWQATPSPQLNLAPSNANFTISWTVPSTNFVLQESLDLSAGIWTTLTNPPALNLGNLQEQVTISPTNGNGYFRLVTQ